MARMRGRSLGGSSPSADTRPTISLDGLTVSASSASNWAKASADAFPLGKVYYEVHIASMVGVSPESSRFGWVFPQYAGVPSDYMSVGVDLRGYGVFNNNNASGPHPGAALTSGEVLMLAKDEVGRCWAGKNGVWFVSGDPGAGLNPLLTASPTELLVMVPACALYASIGHEITARFRFAAEDLAYPVPAGFGLVEDAPTEPFTPARLGDLVTVGRSEIEPVKIGHLGRLIDAVPGGVVYGGRGCIKGTVKVAGTPHLPVRRRVRLMAEMTGDCVAETWSDALTGAYAFEHLSAYYRYTVVSYDHTGTHRAVVADHLTPEPMP